MGAHAGSVRGKGSQAGSAGGGHAGARGAHTGNVGRGRVRGSQAGRAGAAGRVQAGSGRVRGSQAGSTRVGAGRVIGAQTGGAAEKKGNKQTNNNRTKRKNKQAHRIRKNPMPLPDKTIARKAQTKTFHNQKHRLKNKVCRSETTSQTPTASKSSL